MPQPPSACDEIGIVLSLIFTNVTAHALYIRICLSLIFTNVTAHALYIRICSYHFLFNII